MLSRIESGSYDPLSADSREARLSRSLSGTNLERAGDYNLRTVLQAIRLERTTTRVEIARMTGLTAPTIANITGRLVDMGLVRISGRKQGGRGQPALQLEVEPDGAFGIGLNIDRDHLTLVTLDLAGAVRSRVTREIAFALPQDVVAFVQDELDAAIAEGGIDRARVLGVGVAIPDELGAIALPHQPAGYEAWNDTNLSTLLGDTLAWPIHCDNDAASAALGEAEYGSAFDNPSFFYLLISAGLGGGVVIDRSYHRGATARSGEIGLMPDATTGMKGATIQDTVSVSALLARLEDADCVVPAVADLAAATGTAGDVVDRWLVDAVRSLMPPMVAINCLLNPDAVLIGGRLPVPLIERLSAALSDALRVLKLPARAQIMPAVMAQDAPAIGAAILPFLDHLLPSDSILIQAGR
ncbi:ROK family transcriptional regulator [Sphingomonas mollis]|uniref:ROK family transcriptional regulator n=1 Tax=Sphingomonas mollis TaxID=2795726 RepID=A0ABS0XJH1_9SPHN|nr:ROK family transcriptional regulator [Sphingomonas sp. BT553]MBJ6120189.1 ROK family transcriptional regulator [Sphingomonas sp. BT553]